MAKKCILTNTHTEENCNFLADNFLYVRSNVAYWLDAKAMKEHQKKKKNTSSKTPSTFAVVSGENWKPAKKEQKFMQLRLNDDGSK